MNKKSLEEVIWQANATLRDIAIAAQVPLIMPWRDTGKNEVVPVRGSLEILPETDGITIALACTPEEAQEILDLVIELTRRRDDHS